MLRMNWIKSRVIIFAVLIGQASAQAPAQTGPQTPPPTAKENAVPHPDSALPVSGAGPRPLQQAITALRLKYGWQVSYEDPQYLSAKDLTEDTRVKGSLLPSGKPFSVQIPPVPSPTDAVAEEKSLQLVVDAYNRSGNPGQFEVRKSEGNAISVVGLATHDDKGSAALPKPLLDSPITIPVKERTIEETLDLLCKGLSNDTHVTVSIGITPRSLVDQIHVQVGGSKIPARTILAQTLAASGHPLYWQLLFDPSSKVYLLNIHSVHVAKAPAHETPSKPPSPDVHPSVPNS
jgi:hypothetical protein